ncbi:GroES-like protein [Hyaloscypha bicolor E]|uniref:GroES-like protein n=1 Tax=Hyaloscypha bicolor E TaxID=1095630 RepID=A0A2J6TMY0_9HELO|nr:GroES-like protein [Hyaloscypha bicolor E]PMD64369.1 GroES-like protein [Hyaloscypha bicolor E]
MTAPTVLPRTSRNLYNRAVKIYSWRSRPASINCCHLYIRPRTQRKFTTSTRFNMKEAIVAKGPKVTIHDVPIPKPGTSQVLIKVVYSGSNPKDWKRPQIGDPHNSGDDIAGIVEAVGNGVLEFKKGDRVAAFHEMMAPHGSFAEYAIAWDYTTFHLPEKTSFEEVILESK